MTRRLVMLKLRLLAGQLRRSPWQVVGLVLLLVYGIGVTGLLVALLVALRYAPLRLATDVVVGGGSLAVLGFALVPLLIGVDDTLDPRRFALFGLDRTRLAIGLAVAAVVGVPGVALSVIALATVATWSRTPGAVLTALVAAPLTVLLCVLAGRCAAALAGLLLSTRRTREAVSAAGVVALVLLGPAFALLSNADLGPDAAATLQHVTAVLGWTPLGATWAAPAAVAAGSTAEGLLRLVIGLVVVLLLAVAWRALVGRAVSSPARTAPPQTVTGLGWFGRLPGTPLGAVAARSTTYWARDVRYRVSALIVPITPVALVLVLGFAGVPGPTLALLPVPVVALFAGWTTHNDIAYDHTAVWLHVAAGVRGTADRLGRLAPVLAVGSPLIVIGAIVCGVLAGDPVVAAALIGTSGCLFLSGAGLGAVTSALAPYPVPRPGASPFQQPNSAGGAAALVQSALFLGQLVLSAPALVLGLVGVRGGGDGWLWASLVVGLGVGALVLVVGTRIGGRVFDRRGPEILAAALRA
ncbi:ABC transporter permease [Amnibacterium endophyticum]|uniref:ABC transporter permease n=1 Tax=Amnibacterium endophyticum TaxID=2109337 RepID=A0ABW4LBF4_9MICO